MGNTSSGFQRKCLCGKFSTVKVTIDFQGEHFKLSRWSDVSGYKGWTVSLTNSNATAYPCDDCVKNIVKNLGDKGIVFSTQRSGKGFWVEDFP
jgi:hypothetical protein